MTHVVDDQRFVIGLIELYRDRMQAFEVARLLPLAQRVLAGLELEPVQVPIEGYYAQSADLTRYFRSMRTLQQTSSRRQPSGALADALSVLRGTCTAPAFGRAPGQSDTLLPRLGSPLNEAIETLTSWSIPDITRRTRACVRETDTDLITVAAVAEDPVCLCAARESVALSASLASDAILAPPRYQWQVSAAVTRAAERFIAALERATDLRLPSPTLASAEIYWEWGDTAGLNGRCIAIATRDPDAFPIYHWYIDSARGVPQVADFWSDHLWTSAEMQRLPSVQRPPSGSRVHSAAAPLR